ncbi:MAG: class I tRNA ligase family protein [Robiginitomaculum sp.]|nr:class I tRNA ligase family protein [Robiginitomaculum sp.]
MKNWITKRAFSLLFTFCNEELSAFYFDIRKDALYCDPLGAPRRLAARTVMDLIFNRLVIWFAPLLPFTMEEVWLSRFPSDDGSVHLQTFPDTPESWRNDALAEDWEWIKMLRRASTFDLERARTLSKDPDYDSMETIGSSLEAVQTFYVHKSEFKDAVERLADTEPDEFLADVFIVNKVILKVIPKAEFFDELGDPKFPLLKQTSPKGEKIDIGFETEKVDSKLIKCARSWKYFDPASADPAYPDITPRDAAAVRAWDAAHG